MTVYRRIFKAEQLYSATQLENRIVIALFLSLILIFSCYPIIDIYIANCFHTSIGWVFNNEWAMFVKHTIKALALIMSIIIVLLALSTFFISWRIHHAKKIRFLTLAILIGPGLLINAGLKNHWGRARPGQIIQFGGQSSYTIPLQPTNQCKKNCSFVSGHAAVGYSLIFIGAITGSRLIWLSIGITTGLMIGLLRMMQGGHFL